MIKEGAYPAPLSDVDQEFFWEDFWAGYPDSTLAARDTSHLYLDEAVFDFVRHVIRGEVTDATETLRNQLRRYGIRFYSRPEDGRYRSWRER